MNFHVRIHHIYRQRIECIFYSLRLFLIFWVVNSVLARVKVFSLPLLIVSDAWRMSSFYVIPSLSISCACTKNVVPRFSTSQVLLYLFHVRAQKLLCHVSVRHKFFFIYVMCMHKKCCFMLLSIFLCFTVTRNFVLVKCLSPIAINLSHNQNTI